MREENTPGDPRAALEARQRALDAREKALDQRERAMARKTGLRSSLYGRINISLRAMDRLILLLCLLLAVLLAVGVWQGAAG